MATGAAWMVLFKFCVRGLGLISTLILARLLVPADFGLVAMASAIYAFVEVFGYFAFDAALIQNLKADRRHFDTAWTLNALFGLISGGLLALAAGPLADLFGDPRLTAIIYCLAGVAVLERLENIGVVYFRRELRMRREFVYLVSRKLAAFCVTIALAFAFRSYWALVAGIVTSRVAQVALSFGMHPYRPRPSLEAAGELFRFSRWMLANGLLTFTNSRFDDLVVGKLLGAGTLGLYTVAYEIACLPSTEMVQPLARGLLPGYAQVQNDVKRLRFYFLQSVSIVTLITAPVSIGIVVVAEDLVTLLLGEKWLPAVPLLQVLCLYGLLRAVMGNSGSVWIALGRPYLATLAGALRAALLLPLLYFAVSSSGAIGAAWAQVGASVAVSVPLVAVLLHRTVGVPLSGLVSVIWRPFIAVAAMALVVFSVGQGLADSTVILRLFAEIASGAAVYSVLILVLWNLAGRPVESERFVLDALQRGWRRFAPAARAATG